jgi:hypothetical protein
VIESYEQLAARVEALEAVREAAHKLAEEMIETADYPANQGDLLWPLWDRLMEAAVAAANPEATDE